MVKTIYPSQLTFYIVNNLDLDIISKIYDNWNDVNPFLVVPYKYVDFCWFYNSISLSSNVEQYKW